MIAAAAKEAAQTEDEATRALVQTAAHGSSPSSLLETRYAHAFAEWLGLVLPERLTGLLRSVALQKTQQAARDRCIVAALAASVASEEERAQLLTGVRAHVAALDADLGKALDTNEAPSSSACIVAALAASAAPEEERAQHLTGVCAQVAALGADLQQERQARTAAALLPRSTRLVHPHTGGGDADCNCRISRAGVQEQACRVLRKFTGGAEAQSPSRSAAVNLAAAHLLLMAATILGNTPDLHALGALAPPYANIALPQISAAMHAHMGSAIVQAHACTARCLQAGGSGGGVTALLVVAMRAHTGSNAVQAHCCCALRKITAGANAAGDTRRQAAADAGALPQIVEDLRAHPASALQEQAFFALHSIADGITDVDVDPRPSLEAIHTRSLPQIVEALDACDSAMAEARFPRACCEKESARERAASKRAREKEEDDDGLEMESDDEFY
ncbi:hypothetical protein T492DRAFT_1139458 [Pavlovales sp. CCMP2436]|nr:hypothetical protein T492DRAFT_1139458 [Pavlovales sp. CCMP2436]